MRFALMLLPLAMLAGPALAQTGHAGHGAPAAPDTALPAICLENATVPPASSAGMDHGGPMDAGHQALMATMAPMHEDMMAGMTATDLDVAFVCGMIPHHQGAIDMAKVQLEFGSDPFAREMAQKIIAAQEAELAQMRAWLDSK